MKRKLIMHILTSVLSLALLVTISYAWWTGAEATNKVEITTANIASEVKVFEGNDFNRDGNLDQVSDGAGGFIDSFKKDPLQSENTSTGGKAANIALNLLDIAPTEVFTWKVTIKNMGDAAGYVRAEISKDYLKENDKYLKYFSMRAVWTENGVQRLSKKIYFADLLKSSTPQNTLLFGGREEDKVDVKNENVYYFKLELEAYDALIDGGLDANGNKIVHITDSKEERSAYQALQGQKVKYCILDIALTSERPKTTA